MAACTVTLPPEAMPADLVLGFGYRMLTAGEVLREGDEYWWHGEWHNLIMEHLESTGLTKIDLWARRKL